MMSAPALRASTLKKEGSLQTSKLFKIPVLLDSSEMERFLSELTRDFLQFYFFRVQGLYGRGEAFLSMPHFLELYQEYICHLKKGDLSALLRFKDAFSLILTNTTDILYAMAVGEDREIVRATYPVIQLQTNTVQYSQEDQSIRPLIFGKGAISWGIHFSYPQLYQDPISYEIKETKDCTQFPNTNLFKWIQTWIRHNTIATPFIIEGKQKNVPIRIGKLCLSWINQHPQLIASQISVKVL